MTDITSNTTIGGGGSNAVTWDSGTVQSGVGLFVSSAGIASNVSAALGSYINVYNAGSAVSTYLSGGNADAQTAATLNVFEGGSASFTSAVDGANIIVAAGGFTSGDIAGPGGQEIVSGSATDLTVDGGHAYLSNGGSGTNWTAENGGWIGIYGEATITGITVKNSGSYVDIIGGSVTSASATSGGTLQIEDGVTASFVSATSEGSIVVSAGGKTENSFIGSGGIQTVYANGSSLSATLTATSATLNVYGTASDAVASAGAINVLASGKLDAEISQKGCTSG